VFGSARDSKNVKTYPARMVNAVDSIVWTGFIVIKSGFNYIQR
jgi:hypothetical protein